MKRILTISNIRLVAEILLLAALGVAAFSRSLATQAESP